MTPDLLELPAELRAMILEHFWNVSMEAAIAKDPTWDRTVNVFVDCHHSASEQRISESIRPKVPTHALPAWLFLSKAIFTEALDVISRNSRVHLGSIMSRSDVDKHEAEAIALPNGACKVGSYKYVLSSDYNNNMHDCSDWYADRGLPGILAPCIPRRLVAEFPAPTTAHIPPLEPWIDEEIALYRTVFWAYSNINNIREWKLLLNCAMSTVDGEVEVDLLRLGLLLQGARHGLDRVEL